MEGDPSLIATLWIARTVPRGAVSGTSGVFGISMIAGCGGAGGSGGGAARGGPGDTAFATLTVKGAEL